MSRLRDWFARRRRGHVVIIGDTPLAVAVARQQARRAAVTLAGSPASPPHGVLLVEGSADPAVVVRRTAASAASQVFIDRPDDLTTIAVLQALLESGGGEPRLPRITAHVRDLTLRRSVLDTIEGRRLSPRPSLASAALVLAQEVIDRERLYDLAFWRDQPGVHAVIVGYSHLGQACLGEVVAAGIAGGLSRPRVTILDPHPVAVRNLIDRDMPEIDQSATVVVEAFDPATFGAAADPSSTLEEEQPITSIFICLEDEAESIKLMRTIARLQQSADRMLASVHLLADRPLPAAALARPLSSERNVGRRFTVDAGLREDRDLLDLLTVRHDAAARKLHEAYRRKFDSASGSSVDWDMLPETFRDANRHAGRHLRQKLWTAGLREPASSREPIDVEPAAYESIVEPCARSLWEDALIRSLSRLEHERWCAERRLDGWRYAPERDDRRRLHPNLVPFDDPRFTDGDIAKDADQVRFLFAEVVRSTPGGATAPLVLGVAADAPGIALSTALDSVRRDAWRPVVVVCALLNEAEVTATEALLARLDQMRRASRLVVPEIALDNQPLRRLPHPARGVLADLLALPNTRVVPITCAARDSWVDPDAPDDDRKLIARYVERRASAVIVAEPRPQHENQSRMEQARE